jgi:two-component system LytT family response regulator
MTTTPHSIRALIVDDEPHARENLKMLLEAYCPSVAVVATAENVTSALDLVEELEPDVVFLDIMMPGQNGFGFLKHFEDRGFEVIFTTAHSEFALNAFKEGALHYLEKPIHVDELIEAVERAQRLLKQEPMPGVDEAAVASLIERMTTKESGRTSIATSDGLVFVSNDEIIRLEAQDQYTSIILTDGRKMMSSRNIKYFEDKLSPRVFFRVHRSYIINVVHHLRAFHRTDGGTVTLSDQAVIPISRRKLPQFMERIQSL